MCGMEWLEERRLLSVSVSNGMVSVTGTDQNDDIVIRVDPGNADNFQIYDQQNVRTVARSSVRGIEVNAGDGADRLFIDHGNGPVLRGFGRLPIRYDGGDGGDRLISIGDANDARLYEILSFGDSPGKGTFTTLRARSLAWQTVSFSRVDEVMALSPAASLSVLGNNHDNVFELTNGARTNNQTTGRVRMIDVRSCKRHDDQVILEQAHTPLVFANKRMVSIFAGRGKDYIDLNVPQSPAGLTALHLNGGGGRDALKQTALDDDVKLYRRHIERSGERAAFKFVTECSEDHNWHRHHDDDWDDDDRDRDDDD